MANDSSDPSQKKSDIRSSRLRTLAPAFVAGALIAALLYTASKRNNNSEGPQLQSLEITLTDRKKAPEFKWDSPGQGQAFQTSDLKGSWTLVSFWAYWCTPCMVEMPTLAQMENEWNGPELNVILINEDDPSKKDFELAKKFISDEGFSTRVIYDTKKTIVDAFKVQGYPTHFLIDPEGKIVWTHTGAIAWNTPESEERLLKAVETATPDSTSSQD